MALEQNLWLTLLIESSKNVVPIEFLQEPILILAQHQIVHLMMPHLKSDSRTAVYCGMSRENHSMLANETLEQANAVATFEWKYRFLFFLLF